jgi:VWFA-related protein
MYIAGTLALLLVVLAVPAQTQDQRIPAISTTTSLVQLNVVVLDNHKRPVSDLSQADFEVLDDGLEQKLSHFSISSTPLASARPAAESLVLTNRSSQPGETPSTITIVLVDEFQQNLQAIQSARLRVLRFLRTLQPGQQVALYALRLEGMVVIHDLTDDSSALMAAAKTIGSGLLRGKTPVGGDLEMIRETVVKDAFKSIGHHSSGTPTRRNVVWISSNFPSMVHGLDPALMAGERDAINPIPGAMLPVPKFANTESRYERLHAFARQLSNINVSVYPMDAGGLSGGGVVSLQGERNFMDLLASETGGRAFYDTNGLDQDLREVVEEGRVAYLLGYYPGDRRLDGKYHHVEVRLKRPGLSVLCRKGYFATDEPLPKDSDTALRAATKGMLEWSGIGVTLNVSSNPLEWSDQEMVVKLDTQGIHFENKDGRWRAKLDMVFAQLAKDGRILESVKDHLELALLPESYTDAATQGWFYPRTVDVNPKGEKLRVVVCDVATGAVGSVSVPVYQPTGVKSAIHAKGPD